MEVEEPKTEKMRISLDGLLELLGNPTRRVILSKLAKVPHSTSELHKTLGISRQAVHSQLEILSDHNLIEKIKPEKKRGGRYRIKSNLSVKIDIAPDYYGIKYNVEEVEDLEEELTKEIVSSKYKGMQKRDEKLKFLGEKISKLENNIARLERERQNLIQKKECFLKELKSLISNEYKEKFKKNQGNLEKEIFFTLFFNPHRYIRRAISIDNLLEDLFFSDMNRIDRGRNRASIEILLRDLSETINLLREKDESWFFDI